MFNNKQSSSHNNLSQELYNNRDTTQSKIDTTESVNYVYDIKNDNKYYYSELNTNRLQQKIMLSNKTYFTVHDTQFNFLAKICITSFNAIFDNSISHMNIINHQYYKSTIRDIYESYNSDLSIYTIKLSADYLNLKLDEIDILANILIIKQNEKKELKSKIKVKRFKPTPISCKIANESDVKTKTSGYIYFIKSKSFNDDCYVKIGATKRVDALSRIKEMSNASVPFRFYPLAIIYSENAFELENKLHKRLHEYRVNKLNLKKEHFKIKDNELLKILKEEFGYNIEFNKIIDEEWEYTNNLLTNDTNSSIIQDMED